MTSFNFEERPKDKRLIIFDVEIEINYDYKADKAPNPMDEPDMIKHRIAMALRAEFPGGQYDLVIGNCEC